MFWNYILRITPDVLFNNGSMRSQRPPGFSTDAFSTSDRDQPGFQLRNWHKQRQVSKFQVTYLIRDRARSSILHLLTWLFLFVWLFLKIRLVSRYNIIQKPKGLIYPGFLFHLPVRLFFSLFFSLLIGQKWKGKKGLVKGKGGQKEMNRWCR